LRTRDHSTTTREADGYWRQRLTRDQYRAVWESGTERPFSGRYVHTREEGLYLCAACGTELFSSETKVDSPGWPSFTDPAVAEHVTLHADNTLLMRRTEVRCATCDPDTSDASSPTALLSVSVLHGLRRPDLRHHPLTTCIPRP
jgi:peptide-methionine (R)-S-oxide reductase